MGSSRYVPPPAGPHVVPWAGGGLLFPSIFQCLRQSQSHRSDCDGSHPASGAVGDAADLLPFPLARVSFSFGDILWDFDLGEIRSPWQGTPFPLGTPLLHVVSPEL